MERMTIDTLVAEIEEKLGASGLAVDQIAKIAERLIARANGLRSPGKLGQAGKSKQISSQQRAEGVGPGTYRAKGTVGLYLKKGENGSGSWFFRFRLNGKRHELGLGSLADVKLIEARDKADEARRQVRAGVNPIAERRVVKAAAIARAEADQLASDRWIFKRATEEYVRAHASSWRHRDARRNWFNPVERYAFPIIGHMLLDAIKVEHVAAVMDAAPSGLAVKIRGRIEQVISAGIALGQRDAALGNPAASKLLKAIRPTERKGESEHYRRLDLDAAPAAFQKLRALAEESTAIATWVFMIASASRPSEALCAKWEEVDLAKRLWTVPKDRTKTGKDHVVPLSSVAVEVLARQATVRVSDSVFPGRSGSPVAYNSFAAAPKAAALDTGSPHSWRSIFRDWCGDVGRIDRDLAEAALAHALPDVEAAYRRGTAIGKRVPIMQAYAGWLMGESAYKLILLKRA